MRQLCEEIGVDEYAVIDAEDNRGVNAEPRLDYIELLVDYKLQSMQPKGIRASCSFVNWRGLRDPDWGEASVSSSDSDDDDSGDPAST